MRALLPSEKNLSEKELNSLEQAPKTVERYAYNSWDLKGIRYIDGDGIHIGGSLRYIREDLVDLKPGVTL